MQDRRCTGTSCSAKVRGNADTGPNPPSKAEVAVESITMIADHFLAWHESKVGSISGLHGLAIGKRTIEAEAENIQQRWRDTLSALKASDTDSDS